jgi:hypothetical protein
MKTKKLSLKIGSKALFALLIMFTLNVNAYAEDSQYCKTLVNPAGAGGAADNSDIAYFTWETNAQGQIIISIEPAIDGDTQTFFRDPGFVDTGVTSLTVNGDPNAANKYFTRTFTETAVTLTPTPGGTAIPPGATIVYNEVVAYKTSQNTNLWPTIRFEYTYGSDCANVALPTNLLTPTNLLITMEGVLTFDGDPDAGSYTVYVYNGSVPVWEQTEFVSGNTINYSTPGNYTVKVKAISNTPDHYNSDFSSPYSWTIQGTAPAIGRSEYCSFLINPSGGGEATEDDVDAAYFTWTTDNEGRIIVTLESYKENTPLFRDPSLFISSLFVGASSTANGAGFFTLAWSAGTGRAVLTPLPGVVIPPGTNIRYNGIVPYKTGDEAPYNNLYPTLSFSYTYGANCENSQSSLDTPAAPVFAIYPVPAHEVLNIKGLTAPVKVIITDVLGNTVDIQYSNTTIDISRLTKGIYFLSAEGRAIKFIKK